MKDIDTFIKQVKLNCNVSDAKFWGYYSICGLLMRYREFRKSPKIHLGGVQKVAV